MGGQAAGAERLGGLPPVCDPDALCLILGSFPSPASLAAGQYYAHPQNQFWRLLGDSIGEALVALPYEARLVRIRARRIAIWDVYRACRRDGALDASIRDAEGNPLGEFLARLPDLRAVLLNGKTAARQASAAGIRGPAIEVLPSSSPAYTLAYEAKLSAWRGAIRGALGRQASPA